MVTAIFPFHVGPDLDALHIRRPFLRDEAVVDVKRALLLLLKVVSRLLLLAVSFAMTEMVAAHQAKLGEHFHQSKPQRLGGVR